MPLPKKIKRKTPEELDIENILQQAEAADVKFEWDFDLDMDLSYMDEEERRRAIAGGVEVLTCVAQHPDGRVVSLSNIVDPDTHYKRQVEADLCRELGFKPEHVPEIEDIPHIYNYDESAIQETSEESDPEYRFRQDDLLDTVKWAKATYTDDCEFFKPSEAGEGYGELTILFGGNKMNFILNGGMLTVIYFHFSGNTFVMRVYGSGGTSSGFDKRPAPTLAEQVKFQNPHQQKRYQKVKWAHPKMEEIYRGVIDHLFPTVPEIEDIASMYAYDEALTNQEFEDLKPGNEVIFNDHSVIDQKDSLYTIQSRGTGSISRRTIYKAISSNGHRKVLGFGHKPFLTIPKPPEIEDIADIYNYDESLLEADFRWNDEELMNKISEVLKPLGFSNWKNKWYAEVNFQKKRRHTWAPAGQKPGHYLTNEHIRLYFEFRNDNEITVGLQALNKNGSISFDLEKNVVWLHDVPFDINRLGDFTYFAKIAMKTGQTSSVEDLKKILTSLPKYYKGAYKDLAQLYNVSMGKLLNILNPVPEIEDIADIYNYDESIIVSEAADFKKTVKAYKLFKTRPGQPGKIFPLFVLSNEAIPIGVWVKAQSGPAGKTAGRVKSKLGDLAYRPGFHAGDLPVALHIGGKSKPGLIKPDIRPDDQVWAEVEFPDEVDWQSKANAAARITKAGKPHAASAHITDQVPFGGYYRYKTNPSMAGNWLISGDMKVDRILSNEEVKAINGAAGVADLPRKEDLEKHHKQPAPVVGEAAVPTEYMNLIALKGLKEREIQPLIQELEKKGFTAWSHGFEENPFPSFQVEFRGHMLSSYPKMATESKPVGITLSFDGEGNFETDAYDNNAMVHETWMFISVERIPLTIPQTNKWTPIKPKKAKRSGWQAVTFSREAMIKLQEKYREALSIIQSFVQPPEIEDIASIYAYDEAKGSIWAVASVSQDGGETYPLGSSNQLVISDLSNEQNVIKRARAFARDKTFRIEFHRPSNIYGDPYKTLTFRGKEVPEIEDIAAIYNYDESLQEEEQKFVPLTWEQWKRLKRGDHIYRQSGGKTHTYEVLEIKDYGWVDKDGGPHPALKLLDTCGWASPEVRQFKDADWLIAPPVPEVEDIADIYAYDEAVISQPRFITIEELQMLGENRISHERFVGACQELEKKYPDLCSLSITGGRGEGKDSPLNAVFRIYSKDVMSKVVIEAYHEKEKNEWVLYWVKFDRIALRGGGRSVGEYSFITQDLPGTVATIVQKKRDIYSKTDNPKAQKQALLDLKKKTPELETIYNEWLKMATRPVDIEDIAVDYAYDESFEPEEENLPMGDMTLEDFNELKPGDEFQFIVFDPPHQWTVDKVDRSRKGMSEIQAARNSDGAEATFHWVDAENMKKVRPPEIEDIAQIYNYDEAVKETIDFTGQIGAIPTQVYSKEEEARDKQHLTRLQASDYFYYSGSYGRVRPLSLTRKVDLTPKGDAWQITEVEIRLEFNTDHSSRKHAYSLALDIDTDVYMLRHWRKNVVFPITAIPRHWPGKTMIDAKCPPELRQKANEIFAEAYELVIKELLPKPPEIEDIEAIYNYDESIMGEATSLVREVGDLKDFLFPIIKSWVENEGKISTPEGWKLVNQNEKSAHISTDYTVPLHWKIPHLQGKQIIIQLFFDNQIKPAKVPGSILGGMKFLKEKSGILSCRVFKYTKKWDPSLIQFYHGQLKKFLAHELEHFRDEEVWDYDQERRSGYVTPAGQDKSVKTHFDYLTHPTEVRAATRHLVQLAKQNRSSFKSELEKFLVNVKRTLTTQVGNKATGEIEQGINKVRELFTAEYARRYPNRANVGEAIAFEKELIHDITRELVESNPSNFPS